MNSNEKAVSLRIDCFFHTQKGVIDLCVRFGTKDTVSEPATNTLSIIFHRDASVCIRGGSLVTQYQTAHVYRLGAFQLVRERLDAFPLQLHNHTDSDWCLCIGRFSILPLLLRRFQEAPAPSKAGKNGTGK